MGKVGFYAVKAGSEGPSVAADWSVCERMTKSFPGADFKVSPPPLPPPRSFPPLLPERIFPLPQTPFTA